MGERNGQDQIIVDNINRFRFDEGELPYDIERYRHQLPWPFERSMSGIFVSAFFGGKDLVENNHRHDGIDFHVKAGTPVLCIEDGQIIYGRDDERGWTFGDLFIQGAVTNIRYRYCHLELKSLPWDIKSLWGEDFNKLPMVKAGQLIGKVASWFGEIPPEVALPTEAVNLYGRKRDHLHLEMGYSPHRFFSKEGLKATPFNPLLALQRSNDYFRR